MKKRNFDSINIDELTQEQQDELLEQLQEAKRHRTEDLISSTASSPSSESSAEIPKGRSTKSRMSAGFPDSGRTAAGPQAEHACAYILFEELPISAVRGKKRSEAPEAIVSVFKCLPLSEGAMQQITLATGEEAMKGFYGKDQKRENYGKVRNVFTDEEFEKHKHAIKRSNHSIISEIGGKVRDICLFGANKMPYASFPTELKDGEKTQNPNTGNEQSAKDNLKLLSNFIEDITSQDQAKREKILGNQKLLANLNSKWSIGIETIRQLCEGTQSIDDIFDLVQKKISQHVGELFYYERIDPDKLLDKESLEWQQIKQRKYNQAAEPRNNDPEIMYELAGRHLVLVMNCFKGLQRFDEDNKEEIVNKFLKQSVLEHGKWEEVEIEGKHLNLEKLREEVEDRSVLDVQRDNYFTMNSERGKQIQQPISAQAQGATR